MRSKFGGHWLSLLVLVSLFATIVSAWTKEDHEIFKLHDEVTTFDNKTFYQLLDVSPSASVKDINLAYRKLSRRLHPDKAVTSYMSTHLKYGETRTEATKKPTSKQLDAYRKEAQARFARIGVVVNILRGPSRDRYNHFLKNGFPAWRGTGYYYSRFRPGAGSVLVGLFLAFGGFAHYAMLFLNWRQHHAFLESTIQHALTKASSASLDKHVFHMPDSAKSTVSESTSPADEPAMPLNRKQRRAQERDEARSQKVKPGKLAARRAAAVARKAAAGADGSDDSDSTDELDDEPVPTGARTRVLAPNGKSLIVDSNQNVFLEQVDSEGVLRFYHLSLDGVVQPTFRDTVAYRLPMFLYKSSVGRFVPSSSESAESLQGKSSKSKVEVEDGQATGLETPAALASRSESKLNKSDTVKA